MNKLRRGPTKKYVNMRNLQNEIVDTSARPDTMATYFASVHWKSHLAHLVPDSTTLIQDGIPVFESEFCCMFNNPFLMAKVHHLCCV